MIMRKYFFFDIDGTLTQPLTNEVPESTKEALALLQARGHFVAIATGRMQADAIAVAQSLGITSAVSDGGECVTLFGEMLYHNGLDAAKCADFFAKTDRVRFPWAAATENAKIALTPDTRYLEAVPNRYYDVRVAPNFDFMHVPHIYKIFVACHKEEFSDIDLCGLPYVWLRRGTLLLEPTQKDKGIRYIMNRFSASDADIVVFGDGMNDRAMFRPEWTSIAMGNAKEELKALATYVTAPVDEDGIYWACKNFGWI